MRIKSTDRAVCADSMLDTGAAALRDTDRHSPSLWGFQRGGGEGEAYPPPQLTDSMKGPLSHQHPQAQSARAYLLSHLPSLLKVEPWKTHVWQDEKRRPQRREIRFQVLVK